MSNSFPDESKDTSNIKIRECYTIEDFDQCIKLQREAFGLRDLDLTPRRHFIVSRKAGGWTLGAFISNDLIGFVHQLVALRGADEIIGYSHMLAVGKNHQNSGVGARLKWAQRNRAIAEGRSFITWTWDPMQSRNAHFNLNRLGVTVRSYGTDFYGADYNTNSFSDSERDGAAGISSMGSSTTPHMPVIYSDRLFASWDLQSARVSELAAGRNPGAFGPLVDTISITPNWSEVVSTDKELAARELLRVRKEFQEAFARDLVCAGFERDATHGRYLMFTSEKPRLTR